MNVDTGHLINTEDYSELMLDELRNKGYEPVPDDLKEAASRKLAGKRDAFISLTSRGKLSRWAAKQRKAKRKAVKEARRRNR